MGRKVLGVIVGLAAGFAVIVLLQAAGQVLWPLPEGLDPRDRDAIAAALLAMGALNVAVLSYPTWFWLVGLGSFPLGAFAGMRMARQRVESKQEMMNHE